MRIYGSAVQVSVSTVNLLDEIIEVFSAAGLKQSAISILSNQFLVEVRGLKHKNVAAELGEGGCGAIRYECTAEPIMIFSAPVGIARESLASANPILIVSDFLLTRRWRRRRNDAKYGYGGFVRLNEP